MYIIVIFFSGALHDRWKGRNISLLQMKRPLSPTLSNAGKDVKKKQRLSTIKLLADEISDIHFPGIDNMFIHASCIITDYIQEDVMPFHINTDHFEWLLEEYMGVWAPRLIPFLKERPDAWLMGGFMNRVTIALSREFHRYQTWMEKTTQEKQTIPPPFLLHARLYFGAAPILNQFLCRDMTSVVMSYISHPRDLIVETNDGDHYTDMYWYKYGDNDIDVFLQSTDHLAVAEDILGTSETESSSSSDSALETKRVHQTNNALTLIPDSYYLSRPLQLIDMKGKTPERLLSEFDFDPCKIGYSFYHRRLLGSSTALGCLRSYTIPLTPHNIHLSKRIKKYIRKGFRFTLEEYPPVDRDIARQYFESLYYSCNQVLITNEYTEYLVKEYDIPTDQGEGGDHLLKLYLRADQEHLLKKLCPSRSPEPPYHLQSSLGVSARSIAELRLKLAS